MTTKNPKLQKIISSVLLISMFLPAVVLLSTPKEADAQFTDFVNAVWNGLTASATTVTSGTDAANLGISVGKLGRELFQQVLAVIAKRAIAEMTKSTVNWINTGFHGKPLFLENPQSFFKDITKSNVKDYIDLIGYDQLKYPYGKQFALDAIQAYKSQFATNAASSLSKVTNDPDLINKITYDFNVGGWDSFSLVTQYPENTYIGSMMQTNQQLLGKIKDSITTPTARIKTGLDQGLGFLSPQVCKSNENWDKDKLDKGFQFNEKEPIKQGVNDLDYSSKVFQYNFRRDRANEKFTAQYGCPEGPVNTTPGSVVSSKITKALNMPEDQAGISRAVGDGLSAVFDSLFNKLLGDGLNTLTSKINNAPLPEDTWNYGGHTLSGPDLNINADGSWSNQADEVVILEDFRKEVEGYTTIEVTVPDSNTGESVITTTQVLGDIRGTAKRAGETAVSKRAYTPGALDLTKQELQLITNKSIENPGILQVLNFIAPKAQALDACQPGPDKGWEKRLDLERDRIMNSKLMPETQSKDYGKVKAVNDVVKELKFAVSSYKDWVGINMLVSLPDSPNFIDAIKGTDSIFQNEQKTIDAGRAKTSSILRLESIKTQLAAFGISQPPAKSPKEKILLNIRKQFNAIRPSISNQQTFEETRAQLASAKDKLVNFTDMLTQCSKERKAKGWSDVVNTGRDVSGETSTLAGSAGGTYTITEDATVNELGQQIESTTKQAQASGAEKEVFCGVPVVSGYSHGDIIRPDDSNEHGALKFTFRNPTNENGTPGYEDIPMLNASRVYGDSTRKFNPVSIDIDCHTVFKATIQDYKHAGDDAF